MSNLPLHTFVNDWKWKTKSIDIFIRCSIHGHWKLAPVTPTFSLHFSPEQEEFVHVDPGTGDETLVGTKGQLEKWEREAYEEQYEEHSYDPDQAYEQFLERGDDESRVDLELFDHLFPHGYNGDPRNPGVNGEGLLNAPNSLLTDLQRLGAF